MSSTPGKTVTTALVAIPPSRLWKGIQEIRSKRDKAFQRWPPHINLLYPFVPLADFTSAAERIREALRDAEPFRVNLNGVGSFGHGKSATLFLDSLPDSLTATPLVALQSKLFALFPHCTDLSSRESGFRPHLTLGQVGLFGGQKKVRETIERAERDFTTMWSQGPAQGALDWEVDRVYLIARSETDKSVAFEVMEEVVFGGKHDEDVVRQVWPRKYVAMGDSEQTMENTIVGAGSSAPAV
ncbi:hypothetical protein HDU93_009861 [Gonapodya sp. JEL0774]|nr:hypothetical protein HDU93_009861 [Gonapodya sp. JEL0774]